MAAVVEVVMGRGYSEQAAERAINNWTRLAYQARGREPSDTRQPLPKKRSGNPHELGWCELADLDSALKTIGNPRTQKVALYTLRQGYSDLWVAINIFGRSITSHGVGWHRRQAYGFIKDRLMGKK